MAEDKMSDKDVKIPDMTLPKIDVVYQPKYDGTTGEPIFSKNGKQLYFIKITGFKEFDFCDIAYDEFKELKSHYKKLADEKGGTLTIDDLKLLKLHVELWAREKINNGEIVRYLKKEVKNAKKENNKNSGRKEGKKTTEEKKTNVERNEGENPPSS